MSRTIREIRVFNKKPEEVEKHLETWLSANDFIVKECASDGKRLWVAWFSLPSYMLRPHIGSIVAVRTEMYGCIVFEITLKQDSWDTLFHGEFYVAGSTISLGREFDVRKSSPWWSKIARDEGYDAMIKLLKTLGYDELDED